MAPVLAPLFAVLSRAGIDAVVIPPSIRAPGTVLFAVVSSGDFAGRRYLTGEVLVCRGAEVGEPVVLTPRGPGRPMLGRIEGERLLGDAGEPCAPERWSTAGKVERVLLASAQVAQACARFGRTLPVSAVAARMGSRAPVMGVGTPRPAPATSNRSSLAPSARAAQAPSTRAAQAPGAGQLALFGKAA